MRRRWICSAAFAAAAGCRSNAQASPLFSAGCLHLPHRCLRQIHCSAVSGLWYLQGPEARAALFSCHCCSLLSCAAAPITAGQSIRTDHRVGTIYLIDGCCGLVRLRERLRATASLLPHEQTPAMIASAANVFTVTYSFSLYWVYCKVLRRFGLRCRMPGAMPSLRKAGMS